MKKTLTANQVLAIKNSFAPEGQAAADALIEAIDAMAADEENEFGVEDIEKKVNEVLAGLKEVPAPVAEMIHNAIELKMKAVANMAGKQGLSREVKNACARAIMQSRDKSELADNVKAVLVKNGITGMTFGDVIDYAIADKFGNENPLFGMFTQTKVSKFFYTANDMSTASAIAKQWAKSSTGEKTIQSLVVNGKTISTKYIYKRQQVALEDLDEITRAGEESNFINWLTEELNRVLVNSIVMAVLVGDSVNSTEAITTFESIATKTASDAFTYYKQDAITLENARAVADEVYNPNGLKKVAVLSAATKTALAAFIYASGGSTSYLSDADLAGQMGVDELYTTDLMSGKGVIVMLPEEYYVLEKGNLNLAYPTWEKNVQNWQVERNIGGGIHGLRSTAYLKPEA